MHEMKLLNRLDSGFSSYMYQSKVLVNCLEHLKLLLTCTFSSQSSLITSLIALLHYKKRIYFAYHLLIFITNAGDYFFGIITVGSNTHDYGIDFLWLLLNS